MKTPRECQNISRKLQMIYFRTELTPQVLFEAKRMIEEEGIILFLLLLFVGIL